MVVDKATDDKWGPKYQLGHKKNAEKIVLFQIHYVSVIFCYNW